MRFAFRMYTLRCFIYSYTQIHLQFFRTDHLKFGEKKTKSEVKKLSISKQNACEWNQTWTNYIVIIRLTFYTPLTYNHWKNSNAKSGVTFCPCIHIHTGTWYTLFLVLCVRMHPSIECTERSIEFCFHRRIWHFQIFVPEKTLWRSIRDSREWPYIR